MATSYDPIERDEPLPRSLPQARRRRRGLGYFTLFVGAAAGIAMVGVGLFAYKAGERRGSEGVAPVIVAGAGPDKVRPDQPGGMDVPNRDKQIYERLTPDRGQQPARVERLLPGPEAPMAAPKQVATAQPNPPGHAPAPPKVPELSPSDSFSSPVTPASNAATPAPEPVKSVAPTSPPAAQAPAKPEALTPAPAATKETTKVAAVQPAAGGAYRVQIGALRSEEDAQKTIAQAKRNGGDLLANLSFDVKRADLGEKGIYYRVQVGPLADAGTASSLCDQLKDRKVGCMVVRP
jgi:cell division septation protein DedD